jgi:hypothetical protein
VQFDETRATTIAVVGMIDQLHTNGGLSKVMRVYCAVTADLKIDAVPNESNDVVSAPKYLRSCFVTCNYLGGMISCSVS